MAVLCYDTGRVHYPFEQAISCLGTRIEIGLDDLTFRKLAFTITPLLGACIPQFGMWDVDSRQHAVVDGERDTSVT